MGTQTLHLSMRYFDSLSPDLLKELGTPTVTICCLALASKFVERDDDIPLIDELIKASPLPRRTVSYADVTAAEVKICTLLNWDLNLITPYHFLKNYISQGLLFSSDYILARDLGTTSVQNSPDQRIYPG